MSDLCNLVMGSNKHSIFNGLRASLGIGPSHLNNIEVSSNIVPPRASFMPETSYLENTEKLEQTNSD